MRRERIGSYYDKKLGCDFTAENVWDDAGKRTVVITKTFKDGFQIVHPCKPEPRRPEDFLPGAKIR